MRLHLNDGGTARRDCKEVGFSWVKGEVLTVLKAASCDDDWKVFVVVAACVTKVTAEKYDRSVKQSTSCLAGR